MKDSEKHLKNRIVKAAFLLLFLSFFAGCEKAPDAEESTSGSGNSPESTAEEGVSESDGETGTKGPIGTKEESSSSEEDSTEETEESQTETETKTESKQPVTYKKPVETPEGWETHSGAAKLYRVVEDTGVPSGRLEKTEVMDGINVWKEVLSKESDPSGEACYYQTPDAMEMVYRREDGSGIVMTLHSDGGSSLLLKTDVKEETEDSRIGFGRSIRMEENYINDYLFSFYYYSSFDRMKIKQMYSPNSFSMEGIRRSDEEMIKSLFDGFWEAHSQILKDMKTTWYAIGFPKMDNDPYKYGTGIEIWARDSVYDSSIYFRDGIIDGYEINPEFLYSDYVDVIE